MIFEKKKLKLDQMNSAVCSVDPKNNSSVITIVSDITYTTSVLIIILSYVQ